MSQNKGRGVFISFEGGEGSSKTTQLRLLADLFTRVGILYTATREPGGCPIADQIRGILLDARNSAIVDTAELLLYAASRAQHVREVIEPALERGEIVLCDRFTDSSKAYQGYGRGLDMGLIDQLNAIATGGRKPDLTLLFDVEPEIGVARSRARLAVTAGPNEERMELESLEFHRRLCQGYRLLAQADPERFVIIDANRTIEEIFQDVCQVLHDRYNIITKEYQHAS